MRNSLAPHSAVFSYITGFGPICAGRSSVAGFLKVMCEEFGRNGSSVAPRSIFEDQCYTLMTILTPRSQYAVVGSIPNQGVLESVDGVRRDSSSKEDASVNELIQWAGYLGYLNIESRGEQPDWEFSSYRCAKLCHLLGRCETVKPGH